MATNKISTRTARELRYEEALQRLSLDAAALATSGAEFNTVFELAVVQHGTFDHIAKFRQIAVRAYALGAMHMRMRMQGMTIPQTAPPMKPRGRPKGAPKPAPRSSSVPPPMPGWPALRVVPQEDAQP